ncbi:MAG: DNA-directed RNA polymerase subunit P [Methanococci archaeon]|uniref:DNA-directed RNA polymerase subunit Rpo12 n=1 Tax=Methanocaldococcus vulcanius (strain ATCC 700851 / DSM 12094 / M7) TaxID=579137 RepID=C9RDR6_METVM|nr:DNA-directed RNA polymerase subunit P [Methanocaldococcus vulcanius]ACX73445.1 RNA polymerase Rbp10 [Methanocaldococcus vulcanius M7]NPA62068.1 DNA-directed RNA polymerase subunit P [Methanococci archaeon]
MVEYKCLNCKKIIRMEELGKRARCPHCSYKILVKLRPNVVKHVKAR